MIVKRLLYVDRAPSSFLSSRNLNRGIPYNFENRCWIFDDNEGERIEE